MTRYGPRTLQAKDSSDMHCFSINMSSDEGGEKKAEGGSDKTEVPDSPLIQQSKSRGFVVARKLDDQEK